ncbi:MAG: VCBS repeat-containing protein, partial [Myxococcales bacterium]|nr:VCBS repeat-containing protein [Myxococcales bacterium]
DWGDEAEVLEVPVGVAAVAARAVDLDADGDLDLLVLDGARDQVAVRLNDGAGAFTPGAPVRVGPAPTDLAVVDLNGDGAPDLAVAEDAGVSVHLGDGAAGFVEGVFLPLDNVRSVRAGDVDRDGLPDLVGARAPSPVTLWTGRGDGTFDRQAAQVVLPTDDVALVDMDADGWLDLVGSGFLAGVQYTGVALNDRAGGFAAVVQGPAGFSNVELVMGDADDDGFPDAWVIDRFNPALQLMRGDGGGGLSPAAVFDVGAEGTGAARGALADVNADGTLDLVHGTNIRQPLRLEAGDGAGDLAPGVDVGRLPIGEPVDLRLADLDGDGARDVLVADVRRGSALVAWATPAFSVGGVGIDLSANDRFLDPENVRAVAVGDVDRDGLPDVAVCNHAETYVRRGDDDTLRWLAPASADLRGVRVIDVDRDGDDDVVGFGPDGYVVSRSNGDGTFAARLDRSVSLGEEVDFADLNDDGAPDMVGVQGTRSVAVRLNNGAGDFTTSRSFTAPRAIHRVVATDFDDDQAPDLLLVEQAGQTTLWTNDGGGRFASARAVGIQASKAVFAGDVDGDGNPDAVGLRTT